MRKAIILFPIVLCVFLSVKSQNPNILDSGRIWNLASNTQPEYSGFMLFDGDSIVDGKTCLKLWHHYQEKNNSDETTVASGLFYQDGKNIYAYDSSNNNFYLYYNFGADVGDTIRWGREPYDTLLVTAVDFISLRGKRHHRLKFLNVTEGLRWDMLTMVSHKGYEGYWIEGIGCEKGFLCAPYNSSYPSTRLLDCRKGEDVICDSRLFTEEAERYDKRFLSYNPVWSYPILSGKDSSLPLSETVTRKEVRLLTDGGMGNNIPHVIVNIRTGSANTMEKSDHEIPMYEKGGKVFLSEHHYDEYMQDIYPEFSDTYKTREGRTVYYHLLLYDFTLDVGDRYPCKGEVYVMETGILTTRDGISRRTLLLTNGLVIVEGIGCINSPLGLIAYQNTEEGQAIDAKGTLASFGYVNKDGGIDSVYENGDMILDNIKPHQREAILPEAIHDLQGRRLNGTPQKGVYIQNGRKYVK